jgi:hypothetical protein
VRDVERVGDLLNQYQGPGRLERTLLGQHLPEILAGDQRHGHVEAVVDLAVVVDGHDVRVGQLGRERGFPAEPGGVVVVGAQPRPEDLDRHLAVLLGVVGAPHLAHAATSQQGLQPVGAERDVAHSDPPYLDLATAG